MVVLLGGKFAQADFDVFDFSRLARLPPVMLSDSYGSLFWLRCSLSGLGSLPAFPMLSNYFGSLTLNDVVRVLGSLPSIAVVSSFGSLVDSDVVAGNGSLTESRCFRVIRLALGMQYCRPVRLAPMD